MSENKESAQMRRVHREWSWNGADERPKIGDFEIRDHEYIPDGTTESIKLKQITMVLPGGNICTIPIRPIPRLPE